MADGSAQGIAGAGRPAADANASSAKLNGTGGGLSELKLSNGAQLASPAYRLAAMDQDFLLGDSTRGLRFQLEYSKADEARRRFGIRSTIVVFGSARVRENGPGRHSEW